jgi:hypothetical protein
MAWPLLAKLSSAGESLQIRQVRSGHISHGARWSDSQGRQQYDPNAIRVDNVLGSQIGHIPRTVAAKLAPYMVSPAVVADGSCPVTRLLTLPRIAAT